MYYHLLLPNYGPAPDYKEASAWRQSEQPLPRNTVEQMMTALPTSLRQDRNWVIQQILQAVKTYQVFLYFESSSTHWTPAKRRDYWEKILRSVLETHDLLRKLSFSDKDSALSYEKSMFLYTGDPLIRTGNPSDPLAPPSWTAKRELDAILEGLRWAMAVCDKCRAEAEQAKNRKAAEPHHNFLRTLGTIFSAATGEPWTVPSWTGSEGTFKGAFYSFASPAVTYLDGIDHHGVAKRIKYLHSIDYANAPKRKPGRRPKSYKKTLGGLLE